MILDEATSHLDAQLAHRVLRGVFSQRTDRAVLLITHDLQLAKACERTLSIQPRPSLLSTPAL